MGLKQSKHGLMVKAGQVCSAQVPVVAILLSILGLWGCRERSIVDPHVPDEGLLLVDSEYVVDFFPFDSAACVEVGAAGYGHADAVSIGARAWVKVVSTACYSIHVRVEDSLSRVVRNFDRQFQILDRKNGDKNRGEQAYITWDGKDEAGQPVPKSRYLWRMDFNFGNGQSLKVRADIHLD